MSDKALGLRGGESFPFFHVNYLPRRLVLQVAGVVAPFVMVFPLACCRASLVCVPPWHVETTADANVPIVVILVLARCYLVSFLGLCSCW